jgi:hypothetical protein
LASVERNLNANNFSERYEVKGGIDTVGIARNCINVRLGCTLASYQMVDDQHNYRTDDGDHDAADIDACDTPITEALEDCTADNRANNPEYDVDNQALASAVDDLASDEASDETYYQPRYDSHISSEGEISNPFRS